MSFGGNHIIAHYNRSLDAHLRIRMLNYLDAVYVRIRMLILASYFQSQVLNEERRKAVSDEARRLYREEPNLFEAANRDFQSKFFHPRLFFITFFHFNLFSF